MVAAFISGELGGIAKHLSVLRVIDPLGDVALGEARLRFREVEPVLAADRVRVAIERTDNDLARAGRRGVLSPPRDRHRPHHAEAERADATARQLTAELEVAPTRRAGYCAVRGRS